MNFRRTLDNTFYKTYVQNIVTKTYWFVSLASRIEICKCHLSCKEPYPEKSTLESIGSVSVGPRDNSASWEEITGSKSSRVLTENQERVN